MISGLPRILAALVALGGCRASAEAQAFPEYFLPPPPEHAIYPDRGELLEQLWEATDARESVEGYGGPWDPQPLAALMADEVEIFVASRHDPVEAEFRSIGRMAPLDALATLGRMTEGKHAEEAVMQRYGMRAIRRVLRDRIVGPSDWLNGRICTAPYGKIEAGEFTSLVELTGISASEWVIVAPNDGDVSVFPPAAKPYLLVGLQDAGARNAGLWTLRLPGGGNHAVIRSPLSDDVVPDLGEHLCVDVGDGGLKLTEIAVRLD